jgi:hypothetical protein
MSKTFAKALLDTLQALCFPVTCKVCKEPTRGISLCHGCEELISASQSSSCEPYLFHENTAVAFDDSFMVSQLKDVIEVEGAMEEYLSARAAAKLATLPWQQIDAFVLYPENGDGTSVLFSSFGKFFSLALQRSLYMKVATFPFAYQKKRQLVLGSNVDFSDEIVCILSFYALSNEEKKEVEKLFAKAFVLKIYFFSMVGQKP